MICSHFRSKNYEEESYFICLNQRTGKSSSSKDTTLVFGSSESVRHFSVTDATHERGKPSGETMSFTMSRSATCPRTFSLFAVSRRFRGPTVATTWNEFAKVIAMMRPANMRIRVMRVTQKMPRLLRSRHGSVQLVSGRRLVAYSVYVPTLVSLVPRI